MSWIRSVSSTFPLINGSSIPCIGLGTYTIRDPKTIDQVVKAGVKAGYRLIDTATGYRNEEAIGATLQDIFAHPDEYGVTRSDIFITSKLAPADQGFDACYQAVQRSLKKLQLDYIDLYLIHWPGTQKLALKNPQNAINRRGSWEALEVHYREGRLRNIGISNYTMPHLCELLTYAQIPPAVLQSEFHPLYNTADVLQFCADHHIQFQAYSSFGEGALLNGTVSLPVVETIANKYHVTVPAVLLRWALQHRAGIIPKTRHPERIRDNLACFSFELSAEDMDALDQLSSNSMRKFAWDPTDTV
ncbi:hypothetical protein IWQ61_002971 [Dispira simplex]|nr:hypothetical protein IWQ61_002971 [Dispira simplex]